LARRRAKRRYEVPISRLCDFETRGTFPNIFRLYSLSVVYRLELQDLLRIYGVGAPSVSESRVDSSGSSSISATPRVGVRALPQNTFDSRKTVYLGQIAGELTKALPLWYFEHFLSSASIYGYIGNDDWTMWP